MTHYIDWRSIFWVNLPLSAFAAAIASRLRPARVAGKYRQISAASYYSQPEPSPSCLALPSVSRGGWGYSRWRS